MVLYNDLRIYTALKQEYQKFTETEAPANKAFAKTAAEWDIFSQLSFKLGHMEDFKLALQLSLSQSLSTAGHIKLMKYFADEGNIKETLNHAQKLVALADRAFIDHTYPSTIANSLFKLITRHGLHKVQNQLISMNISQATFKSMSRYFEYADVFSVPGSEW